ncbi:MAG: hypothetical protein QM675_02085 [Protaetiibacter sp.]
MHRTRERLVVSFRAVACAAVILLAASTTAAVPPVAPAAPVDSAAVPAHPATAPLGLSAVFPESEAADPGIDSAATESESVDGDAGTVIEGGASTATGPGGGDGRAGASPVPLPMGVWLRADLSEVLGAINAYRASRGLPALMSPGGTCEDRGLAVTPGLGLPAGQTHGQTLVGRWGDLLATVPRKGGVMALDLWAADVSDPSGVVHPSAIVGARLYECLPVGTPDVVDPYNPREPSPQPLSPDPSPDPSPSPSVEPSTPPDPTAEPVPTASAVPSG